MFKLNYKEQRWFIERLDRWKRLHSVGWYGIWKVMNEVKPLYLIPGLNMATAYQLSEYFDIPLRQIKNVESKYHLGNPLSRQFLSSEELGFLALSKKPVKFEGVQHWQYDFKGFSIHTAAAGSICYSPQLIEDFLPYIQGSKVCDEIVCKLIERLSDDYDTVYGVDLLKEKVAEYRKSEAKIASEQAKESEVKKLVEKVFADMKLDQLPVTLKVTVSI